MKKLITLTLGLILIAGMGYTAFDPHTTPALVPHIGTVRIELVRTVNPAELPNGKLQMIIYMVRVDDQFDNIVTVKEGDLIPHLTTAQKNQLIAFMDMLWTKAETEILP